MREWCQIPKDSLFPVWQHNSSEMFNINHFIISQVNPQAVLFSSYNHRSNVWSNPIKGFIDSLLRYLKGQCRSWLVNAMKFIGSRRFRPIYANTRANIGTQILTQVRNLSVHYLLLSPIFTEGTSFCFTILRSTKVGILTYL